MKNVKNITTNWKFDLLLNDTSEKNINSLLKKAETANYKFINKWKDRKDYLENPKVLKEALDEYEKLESEIGLSDKVGYYFYLKNVLDKADPKIKEKNSKIHDLEVKLFNDQSFFILNISKIPQQLQSIFIESKDLEPYKHALEMLFASSKYRLSEKEERIMTLKSKTAYSSWVEMISEFISTEELDGKSFEEIMCLVDDKDKKTRELAAKRINKILKKYSRVAAHELNAILHDKKVNDELRGYKRPDQARHISDDIDTEVVDTMIKSVETASHISKKFYELKTKLLGLEKITYAERNLSTGDIEEKYSFEKSVEIVDKVFNNLDPEFSKIFNEFLEKGQIDVFPKKGKVGGAACIHDIKAVPTFVFLNHTNKLTNVQTLAHEMGHALNNEFMRENQNSLNFESPTSTAEVASTFFEDFTLDEMAKGLSDKEQVFLNMYRLNDFVSSVQRQVACYRFEQDLHKNYREKGCLSTEEIGKLFKKNMKAYLGDFVEFSKDSEYWWVYWSHIRRYFYVYSYASGLLISKTLQAKVKKDPKFIEKVKEFLAAGSSDSPKNILAKMGIDITDSKFWESGLAEAESLLNKTWELAKELKLT